MAAQTKKTTGIATRPPVVTIMGHVDHGKTSILDALRKSNIAAKETGAITQHTGAYQITTTTSDGDRAITFIDTPGHAAFAQMRARGGIIADIIILVVAADDGVKEQTREAIQHAQAADVPIIVAINKMDLATADPDQVKQGLLKEGLAVEGLGGDIVTVPLSAKTGDGLQDLLDMIILTADLAALTGVAEDPFEGIVVEAHLDKTRGAMATVIVRAGTLSVGDVIYDGIIKGKVRALHNDRGEAVTRALPGDPVVVLGLKQVPAVGGMVTDAAVDSAESRDTTRELDDEKETLSILVKADTQGTLEAVVASVEQIENEGAQAVVIHTGVGAVSDADVLMASSSHAIILGFNVRVSEASRALAESHKLRIFTYDLIYKLVEDVERMLVALEESDDYAGKGLGIVLQSFTLPSGDQIAGIQVTHGALRRKDKVRVIRGEEEVYRGVIKQLRTGKEQINKVGAGSECGALLTPPFAPAEGDVIEIL